MITLEPVENFELARPTMSQPMPGKQRRRIATEQSACGKLLDANFDDDDAYAASATWGGGDVLHKPLTVGTAGGSTPIEVTLRNDGAEVLGKVEFPGSENTEKSAGGPAAGGALARAIVYFVPVGENGGQIQESQIWQDGAFDQKQLAPGTYRILALDQRNNEIGAGNPEMIKKYESKSVVVELSASQTLRLPTPLTVVSAQ